MACVTMVETEALDIAAGDVARWVGQKVGRSLADNQGIADILDAHWFAFG